MGQRGEIAFMFTLLEITGDDIALLNDTDLRSLIGLLCEADFRLAGLPISGIMWGGHQDAGDGGMDVVVRTDVDPPKNSRVPRRTTGFQVKKPDMQPSKIGEEMMPKGRLRESIRVLMNEGGAYIIVNSSGSTTDNALKKRVDAMRKVVANEPNHQQLHLDFLDRGCIATWVRAHPSLILWVRNKIGRPLQGWRPYDNWANAPTGLQEEYIVDDELRLYNGKNSSLGDTVINGLGKLRLRLSKNGTSVRLTGLSGVGKTRLVQALFDERIGDNALNPSLAHYTDISDSPIPDPASFAAQLVATKARAVLIVDNCSPELHRTLTKTCTGSMVSLLTVEYDIRDDVPEETDVFGLAPSSDKVIEELLGQRYPEMSQINSRKIVEFAGGNARVAIALANTLNQNESLSTLRDEELFDRLFHQRHGPNDNLRVSAEICSLVYSFDGEDTSSATSELRFLAGLAEKTPRELYRDVADLKNRGLVQARNVWRAILPPAIANRLAKCALSSTPPQAIVDAFLSSGSDRLIRSFTRRLGYLHDCEPAIEVAKAWLKPDGWIGATNCDLNPFGVAIFENIAPIVPEATLTMLERAENDSDGLARLHRHEFIRLLGHLAYDVELFQRSAILLSRLALLEKPDTNDGGSARHTLTTLFHIILSGTHAPAQTRATIIDKLIDSSIQEEQDLGINLLDAALKTHHFISHTSTFGARPRDFGFRPNTNQQVVDWYRVYLAVCTRTALLDTPNAIKAKQVLANRLRGLWSIGVDLDQEFLEDLERSVMQIHDQEPWNEGWISVKGIIRNDGERLQDRDLSRLKQLSQQLEPVNLLERARTYALTDQYLSFDLEDDFDEREGAESQWKRVRDITRRLGAAVAQDDIVFRILLPELVSNYNDRLGVFGEGLADGCEVRENMWQVLYEYVERTPPERRQIMVMLGFLSSCATHDPGLYHSILDSLVGDELLGPWFPYFQLVSTVDKQGIERLHKALDDGKTHIHSFAQLAAGRHVETIGDDDLAALTQKIMAKEGGVKIVMRILSVRFRRANGKSAISTPALIEVSRKVLLQYDYEEKLPGNDHSDYELAQIADASLAGQEGTQSAKDLCQRLAEGFRQHRISSFHYPRLLGRLAEVQPYVFLDTFIGRDEYMFRRMTFGDLDRADSPVNQIPENILIDWCEQDPETRYPRIVSSMQMYSKPKDSEELHWHPIMSTIFEKASHLQAVLSQLETGIHPMSWSGSLADALAKRFPLFAKLSEHPNLEIRDWAIRQQQELNRVVQVERERELKENQARFEKFE